MPLHIKGHVFEEEFVVGITRYFHVLHVIRGVCFKRKSLGLANHHFKDPRFIKHEEVNTLRKQLLAVKDKLTGMVYFCGILDKCTFPVIISEIGCGIFQAIYLEPDVIAGLRKARDREEEN
jgi:hypothetical protein